MKFKHKTTGIVEDVTNALLIPQYEKHSDTYERVEDKTQDNTEETAEPEETAETKKPKGAKK